MENIVQCHYNSINEYHLFKSFEEIKDILNHFEELYFKDKKIFFINIKKKQKKEAILKLRTSLSRCIFNFVFDNYESISDDDLNFISQFYSKYFIKQKNKKFNLIYYFNPINIYNSRFNKKEKQHIFHFHERVFYEYRRYYWFVSLIFYLEDKSLNNFLLYFLDTYQDFYYYYILFYIDRYYKEDSIIKNHYLFQHIILSLDKNNIEKLYNKIRYEEYIFLINLIELAQEKQNLKINIENF